MNPKNKPGVKKVVRDLKKMKKREKPGGNPGGMLAMGTAIQVLNRMLHKQEKYERKLRKVN